MTTERARARAAAVARVGPLRWQDDDLTLEITDGPRVVRPGHVQMTVRVQRGDQDVTPPQLNPYTIVNPPTRHEGADDPAAALRADVTGIVRYLLDR